MTIEGDKLAKAASSAGGHAVLIAAGLAELAVEQVSGALRGLWGVMSRSDLKDVAADGHDSLAARGELVLGRFAVTSVPHMELLARRVAERRGDA